MLKIIRIPLVAILVLILCIGCSKKENPSYMSSDYVLEYEGDKCYMSFLGERSFQTQDAPSNDAHGKGLGFDSLRKLKDSIINYKFTDEQLDVIYRDFVDKKTNKIQICNPYKLYQAVCPQELELGYFYWEGLTYSWLFNRAKMRGESFSYITKDEYDNHLKKAYYEFNNREIVTETQTIEDRNSTVYYYTTAYGKRKRVCYVLEQGAKTLHIAEEYILEDDTNNAEYMVIYIMGKQNEEHFYVNLIVDKVDNRPTTEYLLEFGLCEL